MAKLAIKKASTDVTTYVFIQDSSKTTGVGLAGLAYNTTDLVASYVRPLGTRQALTLATLAAADSAHSDGGFKEVDATNMPGVYRLDLPDAVCATGVPSVVVMLKGATNMSPVVLEIQLTDFDLNTALTSGGIADAVLDEATGDHTTAGSLSKTIADILVDTGTTLDGKIDTIDTNVDSILADTGTDGVKIADTQGAITWGQQKIIADVEEEGALHIENINSDGYGQTNYGGLVGVSNYSYNGFGMKNEGKIGLRNIGSTKDVTGFDIAMISQIQNGLALQASLQTVDTVVDAIKAKTDNLPASPAAVGSAMTLTAAYDKAKDDVLTPLAVVDSIVDGLKTTLDNIHDTDLPAVKTETAAIKAKTDNLPATPASAGEYTAAIAAIPTAPLLAANYTAPDNASIATIKAKTNLIPANPAVADEYDAALAAIQADLDNPAQYKADVSGLATTAHVQEVENKIDAIDVTVNTIPTNPLLDTAYTAPDNASIAAILEDTGTTIPATLAGLATSTEVGAITMLDEVVVGTYTMQDILKLLAAKMVGKATGGGTATITYRGVDDTSNVIVETVDSNGNRSAVTLTV